MTFAVLFKVMKIMRKKTGRIEGSKNNAADTEMNPNAGNMPGKFVLCNGVRTYYGALPQGQVWGR